MIFVKIKSVEATDRLKRIDSVLQNCDVRLQRLPNCRTVEKSIVSSSFSSRTKENADEYAENSTPAGKWPQSVTSFSLIEAKDVKRRR